MSEVYVFGSHSQERTPESGNLITATKGSGDAPLGKYANTVTPLLEDPREAIQFHRSERYRLLSCARTILIAAGKSEGLEFAHNFHRTAKCKYVQRGGDYVSVHMSLEHRAAFFAGLVTCGSVWACPVCTAKIQQRRRDEIAMAIEWAYATGRQAVMVTLTFPHMEWHDLGELLRAQAMALQRLRAGKQWAKFKAVVEFHGLIRALELTYGLNGWHPHTHELWFVRCDADIAKLKAEILKRWESACRRAGLLLPANLEFFRTYSVDVRGNCSTSDYLAKQDDARHWGIDSEMAKASSKLGRSAGLHPFGLLAKASDGNHQAAQEAAQLFLTYTIAMKGRRQLLWSRGLKECVGINEMDDEAIAEEKREAADLLGMLTPDDWRRIRVAGVRAEILNAAEKGGWSAVQTLLKSLPDGLQQAFTAQRLAA